MYWPFKVVTWDPCPFGLPKILTVAHILLWLPAVVCNVQILSGFACKLES